VTPNAVYAAMRRGNIDIIDEVIRRIGIRRREMDDLASTRKDRIAKLSECVGLEDSDGRE
jgi:hypothetical protein